MKSVSILLFVLLLVSCIPTNQVVPERVTPTATAVASPTTDPVVLEVPVVVTLEPTPTPATCTPLPEGMSIHIRREEDLRGVIEVEGLQPDDRPIVLITGEAPSGSFREESSTTHDVSPDGRFQHTFDFRHWESIAGYQIEGQLIHNRGVACFSIDLPLTDDTVQEDRTGSPFGRSPVLSLASFPPSDTPTYVESGDFWLVHTLDGQLFAFAPVSPDYADTIAVDECRFDWVESIGRFIDPCSGDEWEPNGRLNLKQSTELWSNRDLDQYAIVIQDGSIFVQLHQLVQGLPVNEPPLAADSQYGITLTAVTIDFTPTATTLDTLVQVDPIWGMDPTGFPPQQALTYPTFPNSLFDDQGHTIPSMGREGGTAVFDPHTSGIKQMMHTHWEFVPQGSRILTATLTVDLSNLHRNVTLPLDWGSHQSGDLWTTDIPLEIGYAAARVQQIEWVKTMENGHAHLRLTVIDDSPDDIRLYCLHLDTLDPWQRTCANFDGELTYTIVTKPGEPVALHLRANLELRTPFQLVWEPTS